MRPVPRSKRRIAYPHSCPCTLAQNRFHIAVSVLGPPRFDLSGTLVISRHGPGPGTKFFRSSKMLLRYLADLCYDLHSGSLIEAGNGVDDRDLFLEWLGQKAHVLEDTGNILRLQQYHVQHAGAVRPSALPRLRLRPGDGAVLSAEQVL